MTRTATIRLQALAAIAVVSSTEEPRCYLNGVKLEITRRAVTYVATDGHRLAAHHHELAETDPDNTLLGDFIIPTEHCRPFKLTPTGLRRDPRATLSSTDGAVLELAYGVNAIRFAPIDGTFPDWRRVCPVTVDGKTAQFNPDLWASFKKLGEILGAGKLPVLSHNGDGPALVTWGDPMTFAVLMPHRTDAPAKHAPYWAAAPLEYFINLDERGDFFADVRRADATIFEIHGADIFEDGFMRHKDDLAGLLDYLVSLGIARRGETIAKGN